MKPFPCRDLKQFWTKDTCSEECCNRLISEKAKARPHPNSLVTLTCPVCGKQFQEPPAWLKRVKTPTCSRHCNGKLRGREWAKQGHKGRAAWTEKSEASFSEKMSGPNNPAWKGGVMYRDSHGNYIGARYVRCPQEYLPMARKDGYVMEHRLVVAQYLRRCLKRTEIVHHLDHDPRNNAITNLVLFANNSAHKRYEATGSPPPVWQYHVAS